MRQQSEEKKQENIKTQSRCRGLRVQIDGESEREKDRQSKPQEIGETERGRGADMERDAVILKQETAKPGKHTDPVAAP